MASPILIRPARLFAKFNTEPRLIFIFDKIRPPTLPPPWGEHPMFQCTQPRPQNCQPSSGNGFACTASSQQRANVEKALRVLPCFHPACTVILAGGCGFSPYVTRFGNGANPFRWLGTCVESVSEQLRLGFQPMPHIVAMLRTLIHVAEIGPAGHLARRRCRFGFILIQVRRHGWLPVIGVFLLLNLGNCMVSHGMSIGWVAERTMG